MSFRFVMMLVVGLLAACGKTMCDIPGPPGANVANGQPEAAAVSFQVVDFGPHSAKAAAPFNQQSDGQSAMWFKLSESMDGTLVNVHIGDKVFNGDISGNIVTVKVPDNLHAQPATIAIFLDSVDGRVVKRSSSVTFVVEKP